MLLACDPRAQVNKDTLSGSTFQGLRSALLVAEGKGRTFLWARLNSLLANLLSPTCTFTVGSLLKFLFLYECYFLTYRTPFLSVRKLFSLKISSLLCFIFTDTLFIFSTLFPYVDLRLFIRSSSRSLISPMLIDQVRFITFSWDNYPIVIYS